MTNNYSLKNEELKGTKHENAFHTLVKALKDNFADCEDIQLTNNYSGTFYSPFQKKKSSRLGTPHFNPDQFEDLSDVHENFSLLTIAFRRYRPYLSKKGDEKKKEVKK